MPLPEQTDPQFKLRIPADLRKRIADAASDNNRSSNSEIISRLSHSFMDDDRLKRIEGKLDFLAQCLGFDANAEAPASFGAFTITACIAAQTRSSYSYSPFSAKVKHD